MPINQVFSQLIVLLGIIVLCFVGVYYVRYTYKKNNTESKTHNFVRNVSPEEIKSILQGKSSSIQNVSPDAIKNKSNSISLAFVFALLLPLVVVLSAIPQFWHNWVTLDDKLLEDIQEKKEKKIKAFSKASVQPLENNYSPVEFNTDRKAIIIHHSGDNWPIADIYKFQSFLLSKGIAAEICSKTNKVSCLAETQKYLIVSDVAYINESEIKALLSYGHNILTFGTPRLSNAKQVSMLGLQFYQSDPPTNNALVLVNDVELTLGVDSDSVFFIDRLDNNYRAISSNPQALSIRSSGIAGGDINARMHSEAHNGSRFVWLDFLPMNVETQDSRFDHLTDNIMRYVLGEQYRSVATWPDGKKVIAFLEQDTEDRFESSGRVVDYFNYHNLPITWFVLSDLAEKNQYLTQKLMVESEMACHGDNHDVVIRLGYFDQLNKLRACQKSIKAITDINVTGYRPPTEAYNINTLKALAAAEFSYIYARFDGASGLPRVWKIGDEKLAQIPRINSDDFYLWFKKNLDTQGSVKLLEDELRWIEQLGGLFGFSFHSQFMADDEYFEVVKVLANYLKNNSKVYLTTVGEVAEWWLFRNEILFLKDWRASSLTPDQARKAAKYRPVLLEVNKRGKLEKTPLLDN